MTHHKWMSPSTFLSLLLSAVPTNSGSNPILWAWWRTQTPDQQTWSHQFYVLRMMVIIHTSLLLWCILHSFRVSQYIRSWSLLPWEYVGVHEISSANNGSFTRNAMGNFRNYMISYEYEWYAWPTQLLILILCLYLPSPIWQLMGEQCMYIWTWKDGGWRWYKI